MSEDEGYELTDPKHSSYHERMSSLSDERRKVRREAGPLETEPLSRAARDAVEDLLGVERLGVHPAPLVPSWTEKDAREVVSHLGYYEDAEEAGARVILSGEERRLLASARAFLDRIGEPSDVEFLLMGLGVGSIRQLAAILDAARRTARVYVGLADDENDGEFALWREDELVAALADLAAKVPAGGKTS